MKISVFESMLPLDSMIYTVFIGQDVYKGAREGINRYCGTKKELGYQSAPVCSNLINPEQWSKGLKRSIMRHLRVAYLRQVCFDLPTQLRFAIDIRGSHAISRCNW